MCVRVFMRYSYGSLNPSGVLSACLCASFSALASRSNAACFNRYLRFSSPRPYSPATAAMLFVYSYCGWMCVSLCVLLLLFCFMYLLQIAVIRFLSNFNCLLTVSRCYCTISFMLIRLVFLCFEFCCVYCTNIIALCRLQSISRVLRLVDIIVRVSSMSSSSLSWSWSTKSSNAFVNRICILWLCMY